MDPKVVLNIRGGFQKAEEKLVSAAQLLAAGSFADSVSRSYYAVFHAGEALLRLEGMETRTHEGVRTFFSAKFVKTGKFPPESAKVFNGLKHQREDSDYALFAVIDKNDAEDALEKAKKFVAEARRYVESQGITLES